MVTMLFHGTLAGITCGLVLWTSNANGQAGPPFRSDEPETPGNGHGVPFGAALENLERLSIFISFRCALRLIAIGYEKANSDTEQLHRAPNGTMMHCVAWGEFSPSAPSPPSSGKVDNRLDE